jgi:hypothetical protein
MPKYGFRLKEITTVYEEVEADTLEEAHEMVYELMDAEDFDWGIGKMERGIEFTGDVHFDESSV